MPKIIAQQIELELTLEQILSIVRQLSPEEREMVRQGLELPSWSHRLEALLTRVWSQVERFPLTEAEIEAEVELARTELYAQSGY